MKKYISLISILALLFLTAGCAGEAKSEEVPMAAASWNTVVLNGLELIDEEIFVDEDYDHRYQIMQIAGLSDEKIKDKINEQIRAYTDTFYEGPIPNYRGIKRLLPEGSVSIEEHVFVYDAANFNNFLSLIVHRSCYYEIPNSKFSQGFYQLKPLNFDLETGEQLTLADLFREDADYLAVLNEKVKEQLAQKDPADEISYDYTSGSYLKQVAPFQSLKENHSFSINPHMMTLTLYFDETTPEFATNFSTARMDISLFELEDILSPRFWETPKAIYDGTIAPAKMLIDRTPLYNTSLNTDDTSKENVYLGLYCEYSDRLPEKIIAAIKEQAYFDETLKAAFLAAVGEDNTKNGIYERGVYCRALGRFYTISCSDHLTVFAKGGGGYQNASFYQTTVYDSSTLSPISLKDCFTADFDYQSKIAESVAAQLKKRGLEGLYDPLEIVKSCENNFALTAQELSLDILLGEGVFQQEYLDVAIPYQELGEANMTIF